MLISCRETTDQSASISPVEYEVYRFVLSHMDDSSRFTAVVITDSTLRTDPARSNPGTFRELPPGLYTPRILGGTNNPLSDSSSEKFQSFFESTNLQPYKLSIEALNLPSRVRKRNWKMVNQSADSALYKQGRILIVWLSRVALDPSGNEALVYTERACGLSCGEGRWFWLRRSGGSWTVRKSVTTWVS
jgi:hypothetical protein